MIMTMFLLFDKKFYLAIISLDFNQIFHYFLSLLFFG
jgi:hypothetical protein